MKKEDKEINEVSMDYKPFFKNLKNNGLSQNRLKEEYEISSATLQRMKRGQNMTLATAGRLMKIIGIDDINEFVNLFFKNDNK